jgi:hypothetical protein
MNLRLGDKVSLLNEALDGIVSKLIDENSVEVTTSDGFGIPVLKEELVKIGSSSDSEEKSTAIAPKNQSKGFHLPKRSNIDRKTYLCFAKNENNDKELYILNNTSFSNYYALRIHKGGEWVLIYSGQVSKQSYVFVRAYQDKELNVFNKISIDSINIEFSSKVREYPNSSEFKLKVQKLFKESSFSEIPILEKKAFLVDTTEIKKSNQLDRNEELKKAVDLIPKTNQLKGVKVIGKIELKTEKRKRNRGELDLHIEKLNVTFKGKSNGEIIQIQLNAAKSYIDQSILSGKREIILVHGVGSGRLKEELHKLLKSYYGIKYEQADSRNYGDGATMVHLKG